MPLPMPGQTPADLTIDQLRVEHTTGIVQRDVAINADGPGDFVDFNAAIIKDEAVTE